MKRHIIVYVFFLLCLSCTRQPSDEIKDCSLCVSEVYDKVTGTSSIAGPEILVTTDNRSGFIIRALRTPEGVKMISIHLVGVSPCSDENAEILLLFRDGSRLTTKSGNSSFNCDGDAPIYFGGLFGNEDLLKTLQTKPIETMRIYTYKSHLQEEDFTTSQGIELMNQLNCLDKPQ